MDGVVNESKVIVGNFGGSAALIFRLCARI